VKVAGERGMAGLAIAITIALILAASACQATDADGPRIAFRAECIEDRCPVAEDLAVIGQIVQRRLAAHAIAATVTVDDSLIMVALPAGVDPTPTRRLAGAVGRVDFVPIPGAAPVPNEGDRIEFVFLFSGDQVADAAIGVDQNGTRAVNLQLADPAAVVLRQHTGAHIGSSLAITLDGVAITVPVIQDEIADGKLQISRGAVGGFPLSDAQTLVTFLEFGALPFPLIEVR
jgi:hypothetical protein